MPAEPSIRKKIIPPTSPGEWPRFLRAQEVGYGDFMTAFATLGILSMLDERDALERTKLESEEPAVDGRSQDTWIRAWLDGGIDLLVSWLEANANQKQDWPLRPTRFIRPQVRFVTTSDPKHNALKLAAQILSSYDLSQHGAFARWFSGEWRELLWELQKRRRYNMGQTTLELQELITQSIRFQPHQRILMMADSQSVLLWELMEALQCLPKIDALGDRTTAARHGITVVTASSPNGLLAWATLLACEVDEPDVRIAALNIVQPEPVFDWVITTPPFGVTMPSEQADLPVPTRRAEYAALQNALRFLKHDGHAVALMPRSFNFSSGKGAIQLRHWLLKEWHMDAVLEIPSGKAYQGTAIGTTLLYLRRAGPGSHFLFVGERFLKPRFAGWSDAPKGSHRKAISTVLRRVQGVEEVEDAARLQGMQTTALSDESGFAAEDAALLGMSGSAGASSDTLHSTLRTSGTGYVKVADLDPEDCQLTYHIANDNLQRGLEALAAKMPGVTIVPLGEVAEIISGMVYESKMTVASREQMLADANYEKRTGVLRIGDLSRKRPDFLEVPTPRKPQLFLLPDAAQKVRRSAILQDNDVIVSRTGTIGRVNRYVGMSSFFGEESEQSVVASSQLAIVRPKKREGVASSMFLANLLSSPPYQEWIAAQASGSVISLLKTEILAKVPVPLAPAHVQLSIAEHLIAGHPLETLPEVLSQGPQDDASVLAFLRIREDLALVSKEQSANSWQQLLEAVKSQKPVGRLSEWWIAVTANMQELNDVLALPDERDRFSALHVWQSGFTAVRQQLEAKIRSLHFRRIDESVAATNRLVEDAAREAAEKLLEAVRSTAHRTLQSLLQDIKIQSTLNPASVPVAKPTILTASILNLGALSLRDVHARIGSIQVQTPLLTPKGVWDLPVPFTANSAGNYPLSVEWNGKRMDGHPVHGTVELSVQAVPLQEITVEGLGVNPYVDARTLQGDEDRVFFGRKAEIQRILAELRKPSASTVLLIEGNRRTGKTSLIHHFNRHHLPAEWVSAYCTFQSGEGVTDGNGPSGRGVPTREVFFILAKSVVESVVSAGITLELESIGNFDPSWRPVLLHRRTTSLLRPFFESGPPYEHFRIVLEQCLEAMAPRRLLMVIDEFDRLQEGIDSGVTSDQVPENIRHLFQTYNQMAGILTGSRKIRRLREQYWNVLFGIGDPIILRGLDTDSVRDLITKPVAGRLTYTPEAVEMIAHLTAGQPRIVQTFCSRLFDLCTERAETRLITKAMVEEVAAEKARDYEHFKVLWSAVQSSYHQFVGLTLNLMERESSTPITFGLLQERLAEESLMTPDEELDEALANLIDLEVVGQKISDSTKQYSIEIPLLSRWLLQNEDYDKLRKAAIETGY